MLLKQKWLVRWIGLASSLLTFTFAAPRPALAATNGVIAFVGYPQQGLSEIGTINPDGTGAKFRTEGTSPAWSPNGRKMAYITLGGPRQEHIMIRGGGATFNTHVHAEGFDFYSGAAMEWSPDGTRIAFTYQEAIWVMNAEPPFDSQRLIPADCEGAEPTWSPDSARVAYQGWTPYRPRSGRPSVQLAAEGTCTDAGVYIINADGSGNVRLPDPPGLFEVDAADWSPDGSQFAFLGIGSDEGLWVMNSDGTNPRFLVHTVEFCCGPPDWSPDGTQIAFIGDGGLSTVNADGTGLTVLRARVDQPQWDSAPQGQQIAS